MFSGTCQKAYSDCSIVAARTRFLRPTHYLLLTSLIERRVRGAWLSKHAPRVERAHGRLVRRVRGSSCAKKKRCVWCRQGARKAKSQMPQTKSRSEPHPVPAVQPATSSAAVQSLAPAAWQMASASAKVLSREHGQPASDSPHTEQPLRRHPQSGESLTSEQHRTCGRMCGAW